MEHEIDPPSWVVSSGRAFRFRCSSCGFSQSVQPQAEGPVTPTPTGRSDLPPPPIATPTPSTPPPREVGVVEPASQEEPAEAEPEATAPEEPSFVDPTAAEDTPWDDPHSETTDGGRGGAVFLKQNGQIYMVSDWETLGRWIAESRVDRHDLVSEGGVRWEPIGSRPDLVAAFSGADSSDEPAGTLPFGGETPFSGNDYTASGWHDDDTEGIPTGLPPLPTDEVVGGATGFDAVNTRPRALTPTPPPVGRRQPPPVQRPGFMPPPPPSHDIAPPALPDTIPPPPVRAMPSGPSMSFSQDTVPTEQSSPGVMVEHELRSTPDRPLYDEYEEDDDLEIKPRRSSWPLLFAITGLLMVLAALLLWLVYLNVDWARDSGEPAPVPVQPVGPQVPEPEAPDPVEPTPDSVEPTPDPVEPTPDPVEPAPDPVEPTPDPVASSPTPAQPRITTVAVLVKRGWELEGSNPSGAKDQFQRALRIAPGNVDANFGYGYVLMKTGQPQSARSFLCVAKAKGGRDTKREATQFLEEHGLSCE